MIPNALSVSEGQLLQLQGGDGKQHEEAAMTDSNSIWQTVRGIAKRQQEMDEKLDKLIAHLQGDKYEPETDETESEEAAE